MQSSKNVLVVPARIIESGNHLSKPKVCVDLHCYGRMDPCSSLQDSRSYTWGDPAEMAYLLYGRGLNALACGEWQRARCDFERATAVIGSTGQFWYATYSHLGIQSMFESAIVTS
jgi:hypothetical protein